LTCQACREQENLARISCTAIAKERAGLTFEGIDVLAVLS